MSQVKSTGASAGVGSIDLGPSNSIQLMFAKLQLAMSEGFKNSAIEKMNEMSGAQEKSKTMRTDIATLKGYAGADGKANTQDTAKNQKQP